MKPETQFLEVVRLIKQSRTKAYQSVNAELINCYWQVGEYISRRVPMQPGATSQSVTWQNLSKRIILISRAITVSAFIE